ncbi:hypothetical protein ACRRTK_015257 [Alexandromys fortis]
MVAHTCQTSLANSNTSQSKRINQSIENKYRAGEMAQWSRGLAALPEDRGSTPSNHMAACHHLKFSGSRGPKVPSGFQGPCLRMVHRHTCT